MVRGRGASFASKNSMAYAHTWPRDKAHMGALSGCTMKRAHRTPKGGAHLVEGEEVEDLGNHPLGIAVVSRNVVPELSQVLSPLPSGLSQLAKVVKHSEH